MVDYRKAARLGVFLWFKALPIFAVYGADYSACPVFPAWLDALAVPPALTVLPALTGGLCCACAISGAGCAAAFGRWRRRNGLEFFICHANEQHAAIGQGAKFAKAGILKGRALPFGEEKSIGNDCPLPFEQLEWHGYFVLVWRLLGCLPSLRQALQLGYALGIDAGYGKACALQRPARGTFTKLLLELGRYGKAQSHVVALHE